jgi:putative heme-binding domain-containing protein
MLPTMLKVGMLLFAAGALSAQNPMAGKPEAIEAGREIFRIYCSPCHGIRGEGGRGPDLTRGTFSAGDRDADIFRAISEGVSGTEMQSYSLIFGEDGVWRLVSYIRSIARAELTPPKGDAAAGEKLFWGKGACGQCHVVGRRGGHLGPDLTRVGRQRSLAYLRESLVAPSDDLTPGYFTVTVVTPDGKTITGVQRGYDNFSVQLLDMNEKFYSFQRSQVRSVKREYRSLMPDSYSRTFSPVEMDNVLAYLVRLRGAEVTQ